MILGCKDGCLCDDINKNYCCVECYKFFDCKESCAETFKTFGKENLLYTCENAYEILENEGVIE